MNGNDFITWMLRSPFHGMLSSGMMLISVTGRKTGNRYTTPVGYYREGDILYVMSSRDRTWWRNLKGGAEVELLLKRKSLHAFADLELDEKTVESLLLDYLRHIPQAVKSMGIRMEGGRPNPEDITRLAKDRLFIKIQLK